LAAVLMATTAQAAPPQNGNKCTSPQAKCALENGGKCNRATGFGGSEARSPEVDRREEATMAGSPA
jgi:hypothetical protein